MSISHAMIYLLKLYVKLMTYRDTMIEICSVVTELQYLDSSSIRLKPLLWLCFRNMPPRREDPDLARLVSEQVLASLPNIVSQVVAGLNANQNNNQGPRERECTYKSFRSCNPKEFHGTEGAVGLLTWLEGMESVLHISKCTEGNKVEYAACLLQGRALTWWNTQVQTRGRDATSRITWEDFKKMLKEEFCPRSEIQKLEAEL